MTLIEILRIEADKMMIDKTGSPTLVMILRDAAYKIEELEEKLDNIKQDYLENKDRN